MKTLIYLFLLVSVGVYGQNIATYDLAGQPGNQTSSPASNVLAGWTASGITRGSGITGVLVNNSMTSVGFGTNIGTNSYYEFTFTAPSTGGPYNIAPFSLSMRRSPEGPKDLEIRYSINGSGETPVAIQSIPIDGVNVSINFPSYNGMLINQTFRVRIYGYSAISGSGNLRISGSNTIFLPVTYLYFNTKVIKDKVALEFATASEENNDFFQIEKSRDGVNFEAFDRLESNASRGGETVYKLVDNAPYAGINYYRIKQVDTDGKFSYSKISAVDFNAKINFIVLNNRTHDAIEINSSKEAYDVQLYNTSGQLMKNLNGLSANQTISLSDLNAGTYILKMIAGSEVVTERVVKM